MMLSIRNTSVLLGSIIFIKNAKECIGGGVTSKLQIHIPKSLFQPNGYEHMEALFGVPPYGGSIQQNVYYSDSDLCDSNVDMHSGYPANRKVGSDGQMEMWQAPFILMVDRGDCTFVKKVRNAQRAGAAGVIIADTTCLCTAGDSCTGDGEELCETRVPVMADVGSGSDISIPSMLMFKQDADPVIKVLMGNHTVRMEMAWALPTPNTVVEYDLFTTPTDTVSRSLQESFKIAAEALGQDAKFSPHMYIYDGVKAGCVSEQGENECYNLCTNNGRYCATDPDDDLDSGISGADVVKESLRRICIWDLYGKDGVGSAWWDYSVEFMHRCKEPAYFVSDDCVKDAMGHVDQIEFSRVQSCMDDAGGLDGDSPNSLLETSLAEKEASGVIIVPSLYVNDAAIRGALSFSTAFRAICAGFAQGSEPIVCQTCAYCLDEYGCVADNGKCAIQGAQPTGMSAPVPAYLFAPTMALVVLVFTCAGLIIYRRQQNQMHAQVRGILAEYMPVDENNKAQLDTSMGIEDTDGEFS